ncbi:MAG: hypothetical protein U1F58_00055 [Burkholderiales bacterium]
MTMADDVLDPAAAATPAAGSPPRDDAEIRTLHASARLTALALTVAIVAGFVGGLAILAQPDHLLKMTGVALIGFAGSGVGALTSLLARYAAGFELASGERSPPAAEGEVYHRRIAFCFVMRPVLGALVAPLIVGGVTLFTSRHEGFVNSVDAMMLVAFAGGLYAKSILETAKNVFKVVFRA